MKLAVIGKSKKPRSFPKTGIEVVDYFNQKSAWMNAEIFRTWFHEKFVPSVKLHLSSLGLPHKAVLFIDNAPSHPAAEQLKSADGNIFVKFLPPNTTSLIQPMDQGVIRSFKELYRGCLIKQCLLSVQKHTLLTFIKTITILDAVHLAARSWDNIKQTTLRRSWKKLIPEMSTASEQYDSEEADGINCEVALQELNLIDDGDTDPDNFRQWLNVDENDYGFEMVTSEQIIHNNSAVASEKNYHNCIEPMILEEYVEVPNDVNEIQSGEYSDVEYIDIEYLDL